MHLVCESTSDIGTLIHDNLITKLEGDAAYDILCYIGSYLSNVKNFSVEETITGNLSMAAAIDHPIAIAIISTFQKRLAHQPLASSVEAAIVDHYATYTGVIDFAITQLSERYGLAQFLDEIGLASQLHELHDLKDTQNDRITRIIHTALLSLLLIKQLDSAPLDVKVSKSANILSKYLLMILDTLAVVQSDFTALASENVLRQLLACIKVESIALEFVLSQLVMLADYWDKEANPLQPELSKLMADAVISLQEKAGVPATEIRTVQDFLEEWDAEDDGEEADSEDEM